MPSRCVLSAVLLLGGLNLPAHGNVQVPVATSTNITIRVMAANTTTGNNQRYEGPGLRIFQGLRPDVVAVQEFNYASTNGLGINTPGAIREMINSAFGTNFVYFRETGPGYSIPNGIISRWPVLEAGSWEDVDTGVNDRGFAWARIDLPGSDDLYVVSVHLKASSGGTNPARRTAEAAQLKGLIQSNFPANAWIVVAGDCNIHSPDEQALAEFKSYLADDPIPTDAPAGGDADTNNSRAERYDYVFASPSLNSNRVVTTIGSRAFANGLVFDSRIYSPLDDVAPVLAADSSLAQHMAVVKDFRVSFAVTNKVTVPAPRLEIVSDSVIHWTGLSQLAYTVQTNASLTDWAPAGTATSATSNFWFTNTSQAGPRNFYRVVFP